MSIKFSPRLLLLTALFPITACEPGAFPPGDDGQPVTVAAPPPPASPPPAPVQSPKPSESPEHAVAPSTSQRVTAGTVHMDEDSQRFRQFAEELIAVSNEVADSLEAVTDAASAERAAPKIQPRMDRQEYLMNQLAAAKVELGMQKYNDIVGPQRTEIAAASLRATQAHAKVLDNAELLLAWQRGLQNAKATSDSSPPPAGASGDPVEHYLQLMEQFAKMNQEFCAILNGVSNRASAQPAVEQIQTKLPDYDQTVRQVTAGFVRLSNEEKGRVMQELAQRPRPTDADIFSAVTTALRGPASEELRPAMRQLMNIYVEVMPGERAKQRVRQQIRDMGL